MIDRQTPRVLIIAGSDSGGGAGIQADIKTVTMLGGHAMTAVTAITAQNTLGVDAVHLIPADIVRAQIEAVASDIGIDAVKIGMLGSPAIAATVADWLEGIDAPVVFDPVMVATSGAALADAETLASFDRLLARATLATPNTPELAALAGIAIVDETSQSAAAEAVMQRTRCEAILAKGGHLTLEGHTYGRDGTGEPYRYDNASRVFDFLFQSDAEGWRETCWDSPRLATPHTHGTGCTLATAVATCLGTAMPLDRAVQCAREFVRRALLAAPGLGRGNGPMGHQAVTGFRCPA